MRSPSHAPCRALWALCALLLLAPAVAAEPKMPLPDGLVPAVRFWERVYSEVGQNEGFIHDSVHLDVVYETVRLPEGLSRRGRERHVERAKDEIRGALRTLAKGKRSGLTAKQAEVLSRWPDGVSNGTLKNASRHLRFQLGQADRFREGLIRSGAWLDYIQHTLRKYGVPVELAALPHVESSFNPNAYSRVGAAGLWQFTRSTGRLFLRIDSVVDERLDPFLASDAAARLLIKNYEITGAWPLAITAYNHGAAGMRRASRQLGTKDMATIVKKYKGRTFGFASRNFYTSFLAAVRVDRNAVELFGNLHSNPRIDYTLIEMPHYYPATSLTAALGVDQATLREHNGALRPAVWQGNKYVPRGYQLRVPTAELSAPPAQLLANIPESQRLAKQHRDRFHKVRRGETISIIARRYGVRQSELVALNNLRSRHRIRVGQVLTLPGGVAAPIAVARQPRPSDGVYSVRRGDNLSIIARRFDVTPGELVRANGLRNQNRISVGQKLRIPGDGPAVVASTKPTKPPVDPVAASTKPTKPPADPVAASTKPAKPPAEPVAASTTQTRPEPVVVAAATPRADVQEAAPKSTNEATASEATPSSAAETPPAPSTSEAATPVATAEAATRAPREEPEPATPVSVAATEPAPAPTAVVVPPEPLPQEPTPVEPELAEPVMAARTAASIPSSASNANSATTAEPTREAVAGTVGDPPELAGPIAGTVLPGPVQIPLRAPKPSETPDPSDYAVHDGRVTVQAAETLGHYADWLEVRASTLRAKNGMRYEQPLVIGRSMRLDFRVVTPEEFERRRLEYHRTLQSEFFSAFEVTGTERHVLRRGESLWYLAERKYRIPIWLLRQYNPELDFASLPAGAALVVPVVEPRAG